MEKKICVENTFFDKNIHELTCVSAINDGVSLLDFIIVQECHRNRLFGVNL